MTKKPDFYLIKNKTTSVTVNYIKKTKPHYLIVLNPYSE